MFSDSVFTQIQGYKDSRIQGFKDTRMQGYKDARIQGCIIGYGNL